MGFRFRVPSNNPDRATVPTGNDSGTGTTQTRRSNVGAVKARSYGYRSTAVQVPAGDNPAANTGGRTLPVRGAQADTISAPASRVEIDGDSFSPGRSYMGRTEDALNTGHAPNRIDRNTNAQNAGIIYANGYPAGMNGWPYDGSALFIPHIIIPRRPITVTPFQRTIDNGLSIQAAPIGGPIG